MVWLSVLGGLEKSSCCLFEISLGCPAFTGCGSESWDLETEIFPVSWGRKDGSSAETAAQPGVLEGLVSTKSV